MSINRKQIANWFKMAFGISSENAKGLLSHKTTNARVSSILLCRPNNSLPVSKDKIGVMYVGDAVLLGGNQQQGYNFLMQHEKKGQLQIPHYGGHNNSDQPLVQDFPA